MFQNQQLSIKGKEIFRKEVANYEVFEITPSRFVETGKALEEILNQMSACYEGNLTWDYETKSLVYSNNPIYYEILYSGGRIRFNYVLPHKYSKIITNKIDKLFRVAGINKKDDYFPKIFPNKYYCSFRQTRHFMFSLKTDIHETALLDGLMAIINNLQEKDNVLLQIGITPKEDHWKSEWYKANQRFKNGEDLRVEGNIIIDTFDKAFKIGDSLFDLVDVAIGVDTKKKTKIDMQTKRFEMMGNTNFKHAHMTSSKINWNGYLVSIKVFCDNSSRVRYYSRLFNAVFRILDGDQELKIGDVKKLKGDVRVFEKQMFNRNIWSSKELCQFLRLPDRRMMLDWKDNMRSIQVTENPIPKELLDNNSIPIGETSYKGVKIDTYFPTEKSMKAMCLTMCAPSRAGKTTLIKNQIISAIKAGDSVFCLDTIRNCEVVEDVRNHMPPEYKDKLVILDYSNLNYLIPLSFNELVDVDFKDKITEMMVASHLTGSLTGFINSISGFDEQLSSRMRKYVSMSGRLCMTQKGSTIKDVFDVLQEHDIREKFIKASGLSENSTIIQELRHLDDGKGGTVYSMVSGIIDRMSTILNDYASDALLSVPCPDNYELNFTKFANEGKCVLIKLSDEVFSREAISPLLTFLFFKIWMAVGIARSKQTNPRMTRIFIDEIHTMPFVVSFLSDKIKEMAKYGLSVTLSCHFLSDMKRLLPTLKAVGGNFMMLGGCSRENFKMIEPELLQHNISLEEAMQTKPFHSLNLINYNRQYIAYTSKMPAMLDKLYKKYDRSNLDLEHSKKYGVPFEG